MKSGGRRVKFFLSCYIDMCVRRRVFPASSPSSPSSLSTPTTLNVDICNIIGSIFQPTSIVIPDRVSDYPTKRNNLLTAYRFKRQIFNTPITK